ncbi:unnamed protein product [Sphagnum jensenii]|uniref:Uncharacterized protein n=1 Tax=Sphagnum jensenii TaxID=128206 RepID=A0ABP0VNY5_9BRYO
MYSSWAGQEITEKERKRERRQTEGGIHACHHLATSIDLRTSGASIAVRRKKEILGLTPLQIVLEKCLHVGANTAKTKPPACTNTRSAAQLSAAQHPSEARPSCLTSAALCPSEARPSSRTSAS